MTIIEARMWQRRRIAANYTSQNPIGEAGEIGFEADLHGIKVFDGSTPWNSLPFQSPFRGDITMEQATVAGGIAVNGTIRRTQHISVPWFYTLLDHPTDVAVGTALHVNTQVTVDNPGPSGIGPQFQTGSFGPRGIVNQEGLVRYARNMTAFGFAPVGYADLLAVANNAGVARTLVPSWSYLSARGLVADAATCTVAPNDTNRGGAGFIDTPVVLTTDGGTLDGTTNNYELTSFYSGGALWGNVSVQRRIGLDVAGILKQAGGFNYAGAGIVDAPNQVLNEEIGVRVQAFTSGVSKIGLSTAHPIRLMDTNLTHAGGLNMVDVQAARTFTLTTSGQVQGFGFAPILVYDDDANILGAGQLFNATPILKNVNGEARALGAVFGWLGFNNAPTLRGDGAAVTSGISAALRDATTLDVINAGTITATALQTVRSELTVGAGATVTTRTAFALFDATGAGTLTTQIGVDIPALVKGVTNIGIRNASTLVETPATQNITAASQAITATAAYKELTVSTVSNPTMTSAPTIPDGQNGQVIELVNADTTDTITLQDQGTLANSNLRLAASTVTLGPRDSIRLRYSTAVGDWIQIGQVNVL